MPIASIAAAYVARSGADGYTMLYTPNSTHAANIHLYRNIGFDPLKDFSPVTTVVQHPFFLAVHPTSILERGNSPTNRLSCWTQPAKYQTDQPSTSRPLC